MKRTISMIFAAALMLTAFACGTKNAENQESTTTPAVESEPVQAETDSTATEKVEPVQDSTSTAN